MQMTMPSPETLRLHAARLRTRANLASRELGTNGCAAFLHGLAGKYESIATECETPGAVPDLALESPAQSPIQPSRRFPALQIAVLLAAAGLAFTVAVGMLWTK